MFVGVPRVSLYLPMGPLLAPMQLVVVLLQPLLRKIGPDSIRIRRRVNGANNYIVLAMY